MRKPSPLLLRLLVLIQSKILSQHFITEAANVCAPRDYGMGSVVCVCNATYCDTLGPVTLSPPGTFQLFTSTKDGLRLQNTSGIFNSTIMRNEIPVKPAADFTVDRSMTYQSVLGFGGAFTDAAGINIFSLSQAAQKNLLRSYYSEEGIEYNLGRVPMAGCDFSTRTYSYDDFAGDDNLTYFSLAEEDVYLKIPYILSAQTSSKRPLKVFASPWSAPAWMKTNGQFKGRGFLIRKYYQLWADYFVKFLDAYNEAGVRIWGVTAQNEPTDGYIPNFFFNCMGWSAEEQREWVAHYLGPTLEKAGHGDVKIMILDDNRLMLPKWAEEVLSDPVAAKYVDGIAVHWYMDLLPAELLTLTHNKFPNHFILATEACEGFLSFQMDSVILGSWERGEHYAEDILQDLNNWVEGWVDWNLALNMEGGPNWAKGFADSPVIVNREQDEFFKQPMFYAMGHFSKFLPESSKRIGLNSAADYSLQSVAFQTPRNGTTIVILNKKEESIAADILDPDRGHIHLLIPKRSIQTLIYS